MRIKIFLISFFLGSTVYASPVIVLPDKPDMLAFPAGETQAYAADFLNRHLERATGRKLKIIREKDAAKFQERIFIGATAASRRIIGKLEQLEPETLIVKSDGKDLFLCGEMTEDRVDRGTLFAVYEYLERALGIRWYFPDDPRIHPDGFGVIIPGNHNLRLDGWNIRDWPRLRGREGGVSYYAMPEKFQRLWHPVLRFGNSMPRKNANHTQTGWYALYGKTHPEYFAVGRNGRQQFNTQYPHRNYLCPNQPGVLKQMLRNLDAFDQGRAPDSAWGPCPPEKNCVYFAFYVRFCQVSFVTFSYFSYIRSMISLTHVTIGVVCCQNPNLLHLCFCFSKDIFLHFTPAAGKPSFPTFHRPRTFQTFADNMPHAKNV